MSSNGVAVLSFAGGRAVFARLARAGERLHGRSHAAGSAGVARPGVPGDP